LGDDVEVGDEGGLEDDWDVGGVEELDWVGSVVSSISGGFDWEVDSEALEVDDDSEDEYSGHQVHDIRQILSVKSFPQSPEFITPGRQKMEQSNNGSFELGTSSGVDSGWTKRLPDNSFTNIGSNKQ